MIVLLASLVVLDIAIIGTYFGVQEVADKIAHTSISTEDRDEVAAAALRFWNDFRWLGAGLGSFRSVFPRYNDETTSSAYTHAHNDYLEFLCESGVVGVALLGLLVATSFTAAALAQHRRRSPLMRGISFGAMMGMVAFLIQAAVEFNFQIPANALTFVLVLALAWLSLSQPSPAPPPAR
jgi:O-antigen ligase